MGDEVVPFRYGSGVHDRTSDPYITRWRIRRMKYHSLANTGTSVSNVALGAMDFGGKTGDTEAFAILDRFIEAGGNLVDTANVYGGGESEKLLGRWFADRPADLT